MLSSTIPMKAPLGSQTRQVSEKHRGMYWEQEKRPTVAWSEKQGNQLYKELYWKLFRVSDDQLQTIPLSNKDNQRGGENGTRWFQPWYELL